MHSQRRYPFFSIIIAVFNGMQTLPDCLNSVWQQSCKDFELIVIDGGSRDGSVDFINQNRQKIDFSISEPDSGVYNAWNKALKRATGEWVCFLGCDDEFKSAEVLGKAAERIAAGVTDEKYVYGSIEVVNSSGKTLEKLGSPWPEVREKFLQIHCVPHTGSFHHKSLFEQEKFDESFKIAADYEFLLRHLKSSPALFLEDLTTVRMRVGGLSSKPENSLINLRENRRAQIKNGVARFLPAPVWFAMFSRVIIRIILIRILGTRLASSILDFGRKLAGKPPYWRNLGDS